MKIYVTQKEIDIIYLYEMFHHISEIENLNKPLKEKTYFLKEIIEMTIPSQTYGQAVFKEKIQGYFDHFLFDCSKPRTLEYYYSEDFNNYLRMIPGFGAMKRHDFRRAIAHLSNSEIQNIEWVKQ